MGQNGVGSPNLSESVRAVRNTEEMPLVSGSVGQFIRWNSGKNQAGCLSAKDGTSKFPTVSTENATDSTINISFGGDKAHQNTPLSIAAYGWKRTA